MTEQHVAANKYKFGPRDKRGLIFGISPMQVFTVFLSLVIFVFIIRSTGNLYKVILGGIFCLLILLTTFLNVRNKPMQSWVPLLIRMQKEKISYTSRHNKVKIIVNGKRNIPKALRYLDTTVANFQKKSVGLIKDDKRSTLTAVISMDSIPFALLGDSDRDRSISAWSQVLSAIAYESSSIKKIQWIERTLPDSGEYVNTLATVGERDRATFPSDASGDKSELAKISYGDLVATQTKEVFKHGIFLSCTFNRKIEPGILRAEISNLLIRCREMGLNNISLLSKEEVDLYLRHIFDAEPKPQGASWPWPHSLQEHWSYLHVDALYITTYSIIEWPRAEVKAGFFLPLMIGCDIRRTISLVMQPIAPLRAVKQVEQARTEHAADSAIKSRYGFSLSARAKKEAEAIERREQELAAGFAGYRFAGYISVYAKDEKELSNSCKQIEQLASLSLVDIRKAYGEQKEAFLCTLPLGRGCD